MISIIIPLYNKEQSVCHTLDSVVAQSFSDWEIIIVDDGSTDSSAEVVKHYIRNSCFGSAIRMVHKPNGGVSSARNAGIDAAQGEYVAFLDADDIWSEDCLAELVSMTRDFPDAAMCGVNYGETMNGKIIRDVPTGLPKGYRGYVENYFQLPGRISDLYCSSSVLIRRETFETSGRFDERLKYAEDTDMWWRIIASFPVAFYDKYMVFYRFDAENRASNSTRSLRFFLPYYVGKYVSFKKKNPVFYRFVHLWSAIWLSRYYFYDQSEREYAVKASKDLDFDVISVKYKFLFNSPYWIGKAIWKLIGLKKKICS